jgi:hypothetical protein
MSFYDDASLVVIPSGFKTSKVYAEKPTDGSGDLSFTRTGDTATRVGPDGLIQKVRTNVLLQSNSFDTTWTNVNTTETSGQSGYDGSSDAWLLSKSAANGYLIQSISSSGVQTLSVYAKAGTLNWLRLNINFTSGTDPIAFFDLANGVLGSTPAGVIDSNIQSIGGGWYRCDITSNGTISDIRIFPADADNDISGTSGNIYIQDAQLEASDFGATAYISTTTAAVSVGPVANVPRLDYLGSTCPRLLLEPQRTNLITYSERINDASWSKALGGAGVAPVVTANYGISPSGYADADRIQFNAGGITGSDRSLLRKLITLTATQHALSFYVKSNSGTVTLAFTFNGGTVGSITATESGWTRVSYVGTGTGALSTYGIELQGSTTSQTADILFWGAQLEAGAYATSYIPTLAASATRGADACSKTGISSLINSQEGTFFVDMAAFSANTGTSLISLSDGSVTNTLYIGFTSTTNQIGMALYAAGVAQSSINSFSFDVTESNKIAVSYKVNEVKMYVNGTLIGTDTSATMPAAGTLSQLKSNFGQGSFPLYANVKQVIIFPTALTNAELAELTTL